MFTFTKHAANGKMDEKKKQKNPKVNLKFSKIMHDRACACGETKSLFMCRFFNFATLNRVKWGVLIRYSFLFCLNMQTETLQRKKILEQDLISA